MTRRRMTQIFPWLLPLRRWQRRFCFYAKMGWDGIPYATCRERQELPYPLFETSCPMYNRETGFDMVYQENKVFNLKLAAATLDHLLIRPGETFSFWRLVRYADRDTPYREGLAEVDGKLTVLKGGGLCQLSNLLCWMFLHTPLTLTERHGHQVKDFPEPPSDAPLGVDATVAEGWLDLRVRNDTEVTFQIAISFDQAHITGRVYTARDLGLTYEAINENLVYYRQNGRVYEGVDVVQRAIDTSSGICCPPDVPEINAKSATGCQPVRWCRRKDETYETKTHCRPLWRPFPGI